MVSKSGADNEVEEIPVDITCTIDITEEDDEICEVEHLRKLFIGGLSAETTDEKLRRFYSKWGKVVDSVVMKDSITKRSRGFGFITYTKTAMVDKAQASRPHVIDGKKVESKRALPRPEQQPPKETKKSISVKKLFVGGLKDEHDEECLKEYFSQFGNVVSVNILIDNTTGKRRGFALIEYDDYDAVDKAILQKTHLIKLVLVDVRKSVYTQEQKKNTEKDHGRNQERSQEKYQGRDQLNKPDFRMRSGQYQNNMQQQQRPYQRAYQGMSRQPPMPAQQQPYQQMPPNQQGPPPNYNQWGPPPQYPHGPPQAAHVQPPPPQPPQQYQQSMPHQNYGGYQQPPMPPAPHQPANWNGYPPMGNNWNAPPPQAPPPPVPTPAPSSGWQNNQWGAAPTPAGTAAHMPPGNQPPPNWQQPPPPQNSGPPQHQQPPAMYPQQHQQQQPPPPPPLPHNFGNGYQQNYGGGPTKHQNMYTNRMNPYNAPPNQYSNPPVQGYGNPMPNGNKYRR